MSDLTGDDLDSLLDEVTPGKGKAVPLKRTAAVAKKQEVAQEKLAEQKTAAQLAQIVNLVIAGHSLADIGAQIGATADEVDRLLQQDTQRYIRSQPALRTYVRNYISGKYSELLAVNWPFATDPLAKDMLEHEDRALKILDKIAKLHGAEAPTQSEVTVDAAPEAVEKMMTALTQARGVGYDTSVFDIVDAEVVEDAVVESAAALEVSGNAVEQPQDGDEDL